ncbi:hypothetical protein INT45_013584 [Circinella minor]|uniref:CxC2-like cysteine cluster KDZ transposase-associated domain-containing protein n=1 Tax=Circinella minor TaxID=1195481 RepID=A0A8H7RRK8_9FUNG|nr:hypothetical protein INT45_013584 [Circinella minor]
MGRSRKLPLYGSINGYNSSDEEFDIIVDTPKRSKRSNSRERRQEEQGEQQYQEQESLNLDLDNTNSQWEHVDDMAEQDYGYEGSDEGNEEPATQRRPYKTHRLSKKERFDISWIDLLPKLKSAYLLGIARNPIDIQSLDTPAIPDCTCDAKYKRQQTVTCIFLCGVRQHTFQHCNNCPDEQRSLPVVLLEKHLFPTTPTNTKIAIHIEVIRRCHNMRLVGRVPINTIFDLMKADYKKTSLPPTLRNTLYPALVNYSKFKLLLDNDINSLCNIQHRTCPICSQMKSDGLMVPISMDGNFQLKRFNQSFDSSAVDPCAEIINTLWKANNDVTSGSSRAELPTTDNYCEGWKSLSKSGSRSTFVPTTGVFASICSRHDFVLALVDMQTTGEKIEYPLSILNQVKETYGTNLCIAYDVSCKLDKAIECTEKISDLKEAPLTIGAFDIYGHEASCQAQYHPKLIPNLGLIDGEVNHYHEQKFEALGHKRAVTLSTQLSKALKKLTTAVNNYNRTVNESEALHANDILKKDSNWRNEHDVVNDRTSVFVESQSGIDDDCASSEDDNDEDEDDGNDELETIAALLEEQVNSDTNDN